jgi:hypothetical protein
MDRKEFRNKVLRKLLYSGAVLIPGLLGLGLLCAALLTGQATGVLGFAGVCGVLTGIGALATRWITKFDRITREAIEDLQRQASREEERMLDALDRKLQEDEDPRTEESLRELREIYASFKQDSGWSRDMRSKTAMEIASKVETLFQGCLESLRGSLELWEAASKMRTRESRKAILERREALVGEIRESIRQLAKTVDGVRALSLHSGETQDLARVRRELDESLEVARRVEERMRSFDSDLRERASSGTE